MRSLWLCSKWMKRDSWWYLDVVIVGATDVRCAKNAKGVLRGSFHVGAKPYRCATKPWLVWSPFLSKRLLEMVGWRLSILSLELWIRSLFLKSDIWSGISKSCSKISNFQHTLHPTQNQPYLPNHPFPDPPGYVRIQLDPQINSNKVQPHAGLDPCRDHCYFSAHQH